MTTVVNLETLPTKTKSELVEVACDLGICRTKTEARKMAVDDLRSLIERHFRSLPDLAVSYEDTTASGEALPEPVTELPAVAPVLEARELPILVADYPALEARALAEASRSPGGVVLLERAGLEPPVLPLRPLLPTFPAPPSFRLPHNAATPAEAYQAAQRRKARNRRKHKRKLAGNPSGHRYRDGWCKPPHTLELPRRITKLVRDKWNTTSREPEGSSGFGRPL